MTVSRPFGMAGLSILVLLAVGCTEVETPITGGGGFADAGS